MDQGGRPAAPVAQRVVPVAHHAALVAHRVDPAALVVHRAAPAGRHEDRAEHHAGPVAQQAQRVVPVAHHAALVVHRAAPAAPDRLADGRVAGFLLAHHGAACDPCPAARSRIASMA